MANAASAPPVGEVDASVRPAASSAWARHVSAYPTRPANRVAFTLGSIRARPSPTMPIDTTRRPPHGPVHESATAREAKYPLSHPGHAHTLKRNSTPFRHVGPSVSAPVDVAPAPCRDDHDEEFVIMDLVDDSPVPRPNAPSVATGEFLRRWRPRLVSQQEEHGGDSRLTITRELADLTPRGGRDSNRMGHRPSSRRSSSSVTLSPPSAFAAS